MLTSPITSTLSVAQPERSWERLKLSAVTVLATAISERSTENLSIFALFSKCQEYNFASSLILLTASRSFSIIAAILSELCTTSGKSLSSIFLAVSRFIQVSSAISLNVRSGSLNFAAITAALSLSFVLDPFISKYD